MLSPILMNSSSEAEGVIVAIPCYSECIFGMMWREGVAHEQKHDSKLLF